MNRKSCLLDCEWTVIHLWRLNILVASILGYPSPDLQWYQVLSGGNLKAINDDERHRVHVLISYGQTLSMDEFWFQLTIINVQGNDYGQYMCEGTNNLGVHRATISLYGKAGR